MEPLLELRQLSVTFATNYLSIPVVRGVDLQVGQGEIIGLVGESGCGKSVTCMAAMGLLDDNVRLGGEVHWKNELVDPQNDVSMSRLRGREIAMIFQDPMSALNPVQTIGKQLIEAIRVTAKTRLNRKTLRNKAVELLRDVGIPDPEKRLKTYPHQLSGGLSQRVMIAMMLAGEPDLLIADEPTTALDVTVQAQIMDLLRDLRDKRGMSIILVTHDLGVVAEVCDRMVVMYCGRVIETGTVQTVFNRPHHPYTSGLLASLPRVDGEDDELTPIPGVVPQPHEFGAGCDFATRCPRVSERCYAEFPDLKSSESKHKFACFSPFSAEYEELEV